METSVWIKSQIRTSVIALVIYELIYFLFVIFSAESYEDFRLTTIFIFFSTCLPFLLAVLVILASYVKFPLVITALALFTHSVIAGFLIHPILGWGILGFFTFFFYVSIYCYIELKGFKFPSSVKFCWISGLIQYIALLGLMSLGYCF